MKRAIVTTILAAGLAIGTMGSAYAAKGGKSGQDTGGSQATQGATLYYECDTASCYAGETVYFWGDGYDASQGKALLQIDGMWTSVAVAADGSVDFNWAVFGFPGDYSVQLYQNGKGHKLELKAEKTVTMY